MEENRCDGYLSGCNENVSDGGGTERVEPNSAEQTFRGRVGRQRGMSPRPCPGDTAAYSDTRDENVNVRSWAVGR
jgi:hypothetical protein